MPAMTPAPKPAIQPVQRPPCLIRAHLILTGLLLCLCLLAPQAALAGAWPRGKGNNFATSTLRVALSQTGELSRSFSYFHEYGLTDRLTLTGDMGGAISGLDKLVLYLSVPLPDLWGVALAFDMGGGTIAGQQVLRPGLSFGRGLQRPSGWISGELVAEVYPETGALDWKFDTTFGLSPGERAKYYVQLQTGQRQGDLPFARLAGSAAIRLRPGLFLDIGGSAGLANTDPYRVKLGIWKEF